MVGLADRGATGALKTAGQDNIYLEAIVEGRSRDIVIEIEDNGQIVSQQALGLRVSLPVKALTKPVDLRVRRHTGEPFGAGFNPILQITSGTNQADAIVMAGLDIAGRSAPVIATLVLENDQVKVARSIGRSTVDRPSTAPARERILPSSDLTVQQNGAIDVAVPASPAPSRTQNGHGIRQVVRHAVNRRTENGEALPTGQWDIWLDSSTSVKAQSASLALMQAILEEILAAVAVPTPSSNSAEDWIGSPNTNYAQDSVVITDLPFSADTTSKMVVINAAQLEDVFGAQPHIFYCKPADVEALITTGSTPTNESDPTADCLINTLLDFLTLQTGGN